MGWLGALIGGGSSLLSGILGSNAAGNAADSQVNAANAAGMGDYNLGQQALGLQRNTLLANLGMAQPYLQAGTGATVNLANMLGVLPSDQLASQSLGAAQSAYNPAQAAAPRFGGSTYHDSHGIWTYQGSDGAHDVYSRTAGGDPAWLTLGPDGRQSAAGAYPNQGSIIPAGQALPGTGGTASGAPGSGGTTSQGSTNQPALSSYVNPALGGSGSLLAPFQAKFSAPTDVTEQNDPGFQFRLQQGLKALQNSAAARGGLLSGGTAKGLNDYAQGQASNEYGNVYNRALQQYLLPQQNAMQQYNMLAGMSGAGQAQTQNLAGLSAGAANASGNILGNMASGIGNNLNNAGAARASGYVGGTNALANGISGLGGDIGGMLTLSSMLKNGQGQQDLNTVNGMGGPMYI